MNLDDASTPSQLAAQSRVVVIGGGIAGLVAALECAKIGMRVTLVEASTRLGGTIRSAELAGLSIDVGTKCFSTRGGIVPALVAELGLSDDVVSPTLGTPWVAGLPGGVVAPLPAGGMLGIPENAFAVDVLRILGWRGAWRAYFDRVRPVLTIGTERSLGRLVRTRMGELVRDRLVAPVTRGVYAIDPDEVDVDLAAPGLNAALTRTGSLSGGVVQLGESRDDAASTIASLRGGMTGLVDAFAERLTELGVELRLETEATGLERDAASGWDIYLAAAGGDSDSSSNDSDSTDDDSDPDSDSGDQRIESAPIEPLHADFVIIATEETPARALLGARLRSAAVRPATRIDVVTLVLDDAGLDRSGKHGADSTGLTPPYGPEVFAVAGTPGATSLVHESAVWPWLAERLTAEAPHRHVVRVSFGVAGESPATAGLDDGEATALSLAQASTMLGVPLASDAVVESHRESFTQARPAVAIGLRDEAAAVRAALAAHPGLVAVGAWLAGSGLAQVIPDAQAQAEVVRQAALWGAEPSN